MNGTDPSIFRQKTTSPLAGEVFSVDVIKLDVELCHGCGEDITDKFLLKVSGRSWHGSCLRCCICQATLDNHSSCFIRKGFIYCRGDYAKSFSAKCSKCCRSISASDWVRKARDHVYHLACFSCDSCKRQLSTGEEFALHEDRVLCKAHYLEIMHDSGRSSADDTLDGEGHVGKSKSKRVRTTFTDDQLQILQANFQLDSNPDGQDLERIAQITGLSKRVTQVWFQNSRARQKKHSMIHHHHHNLLLSGGKSYKDPSMSSLWFGAQSLSPPPVTVLYSCG